MARLLGVKQAAEVLGVHPQTVRGWTRKGLLASTRLPGSRYRRFDPEELARFRAGYASGSPGERALQADDPLFELDGAGDSGLTDTVSRLHEELASALEVHGEVGTPRARRSRGSSGK